MSLEPSLAATVARLDREDERASGETVNWGEYRACSTVCRAKAGEPCISLSGKIVAGRPDDVRTPLDVPHAARKRRKRRAVK